MVLGKDGCCLLMRSLRLAIGCLVAVLGTICIAIAPTRAADQFREDAIKAAFLYRFTGYVEWPASSSTADRFTIAVIGGEAVATELGKILQGHDIAGRPARVQQIQSLKEVGDAQMLYI